MLIRGQPQAQAQALAERRRDLPAPPRPLKKRPNFST